MAEEGATEISVGEFETIPQLLASSESLQKISEFVEVHENLTMCMTLVMANPPKLILDRSFSK